MNICNLCLTNEADKTNSHIFPRFMGVTMLKTSDNVRQGFTIDKDQINRVKNKKKPKIDQDTPKEDYIICSQCEKLIEKLENHFAKYQYNCFNKTFFTKNNSAETIIKNHLLIENSKLDYFIFKKFTYSLLFRASISSLTYFKDIHVHHIDKESIRKILLGTIPFIDYPTYCLTSISDKNFTENYIYANSELDNKAHFMWVNDYIFFIDFGSNSDLLKSISWAINLNESITKIGLLHNIAWDSWRKILLANILNK